MTGRIRNAPPLVAGGSGMVDAPGAVARYFSQRYPRRTAIGGVQFLRRGEDDRAAAVAQWVPRWDGLAVLDAGCGDGAFLRRVMTGRPARLRLEDLSSAQLARASAGLAGRAEAVEAAVADACTAGGAGGFDVVLALGVADYVGDWRRFVRALLARSAGVLIADFPRRGRPHHLLRRGWLALHGVRLSTGARREVEAALAECGARAEVVPLPLHWLVRIERGEAG